MKIQKKIMFFFFMRGGGGGSGRGGDVRGASQGGCEQRIEVFVKIPKKKNWGERGGWGGGLGRVGGAGSGWGVRMDVNEELKFL